MVINPQALLVQNILGNTAHVVHKHQGSVPKLFCFVFLTKLILFMLFSLLLKDTTTLNVQFMKRAKGYGGVGPPQPMVLSTPIYLSHRDKEKVCSCAALALTTSNQSWQIKYE